MSHQQPPLQTGGATVIGASTGKQLAVTGIKAIKQLLLLAAGLTVAGAALLRRGRNAAVDAGRALDD